MQRLSRSIVKIGHPYTATVLYEVVPGMIAGQLQPAIQARAQVQQRRLRPRLSDVDVGSELLIWNRRICALDESRDLAVRDLAIPVGVCGTEKARAHLVA